MTSVCCHKLDLENKLLQSNKLNKKHFLKLSQHCVSYENYNSPIFSFHQLPYRMVTSNLRVLFSLHGEMLVHNHAQDRRSAIPRGAQWAVAPLLPLLLPHLPHQETALVHAAWIVIRSVLMIAVLSKCNRLLHLHYRIWSTPLLQRQQAVRKRVRFLAIQNALHNAAVLLLHRFSARHTVLRFAAPTVPHNVVQQVWPKNRIFCLISDIYTSYADRQWLILLRMDTIIIIITEIDYHNLVFLQKPKQR